MNTFQLAAYFRSRGLDGWVRKPGGLRRGLSLQRVAALVYGG